MNYFKIYNNLIETRKQLYEIRIIQKKNKTEYFENHHIIPKCMNGTNNIDNLVLLTAREHFIAHAILVKMYPTNKKITNAFLIMMFETNKHNRYMNNKLYESLKKYWHQTHSGKNHHLYGIGHTQETKNKISKARKNTIVVKDKEGNKFTVSTSDTRYLNGELVHHTKGRIFDEKEKNNISIRTKGILNGNSSNLTDDDIINYGITYYKLNNKFSYNEWIEYCKQHKIPQYFTKFRFSGNGYKGFLNKLEEKIGHKLIRK